MSEKDWQDAGTDVGDDADVPEDPLLERSRAPEPGSTPAPAAPVDVEGDIGRGEPLESGVGEGAGEAALGRGGDLGGGGDVAGDFGGLREEEGDEGAPA